MTTRAYLKVLALMAMAVPALAANRAGVSVAHVESPERISIHSGSPVGQAKPGETAAMTLAFDAFGRRFDLALSPNTPLMRALPANGATTAVAYRGRIRGVPGSWARIVISDDVPAGLIWDGTELFALEAPGDAIVDTRSPIAYRIRDLNVMPGTLSCAAGQTGKSGHAAFKALVDDLGSTVQQGPGAVSEITIGAAGDFEFASDHGTASESALLARLNNVDGIYSEQLGVQVRVAEVEIFTDAADPFSDTTVPGDLLDEVATYRFGTTAQRNQGLTHLYTGRDLDGSTVGIAYTGVLCSSAFGVGLSEGNGGLTLDSLIAAHEIGHNFGAPHDAESGSACESEPPDFIMATTLNGSDQFSACSIQQMQGEIAGASCIDPLPSTDISLSFTQASLTALLGGIARVTIDVVNNGTEVAENVVVDITLPGIVAYVDASGGSASCSASGSDVSCQLGTVAGNGAVTLAVVADAVAIGAGGYSASVSADADDRANNNLDTLALTVDPAVDLVMGSPTSATIDLNQSASLNVTMDNQSSIDATGATVSISLDAGLRADSASWSIGTCVVSDRQVDCTAGQFDSLSSSSLTVGLTGISTGNRSVSFDVAANEADANPDDNNATAAVRVNSTSGGDDDDGAGSAGWFLLLLLAAAAGLRSMLRAGQVRDIR